MTKTFPRVGPDDHLYVGFRGGFQNIRDPYLLRGKKTENDFDHYDRSSTAIFILCGLGQNCKAPGQPTTAEGTALRREALELALYTMEYTHPIDNVLVFFPPVAAEKTFSDNREMLGGQSRNR